MSGDPVCMNCGGLHPGVCPSAARPVYFDTATFASVPLPEHMSRDQLCELLGRYLNDRVFAARFADCMEMIRKKNADYTQGTAKRDRIAAFRRIGGDINVPMTKVWAIFAQKHWGAVMKFVKDGQVESEPIDGRINDLINYFVLLGAIIHDGEEEL